MSHRPLRAQVLGEFGVPASVAGTLWALAPETEPPTSGDIASRLRCDPSTVSLAANRLQSMGLVDRQPRPADARKRVLVLTEDEHELASPPRHEPAWFLNTSRSPRRRCAAETDPQSHSRIVEYRDHPLSGDTTRHSSCSALPAR